MTILDEVIVERQRIQDVKVSGRPIVKGWFPRLMANALTPLPVNQPGTMELTSRVGKAQM